MSRVVPRISRLRTRATSTMSKVPLSEIPTLSLLYKLDRLKASTPSSYEPSTSYNDKISLIRHDITKLEVDSIVNAANRSLLGGGGVDGAIHRAAGRELLYECEKLNGCETGSAKITGAYKLDPIKKIIHAVGPVYWDEKKTGTHTEKLQGCYRKSLELAVENGLTSIAFSALSTGIYGYPSGEAAEAAIEEVRKFLDSGKGDSLERIVFCSFMEKDEKAYIEIVPGFFPPSKTINPEEDTTNDEDEAQEEEGDTLAAKLPDAPKNDPVEEGQPETKKLKSSHVPESQQVEAETEASESRAEKTPQEKS